MMTPIQLRNPNSLFLDVLWRVGPGVLTSRERLQFSFDRGDLFPETQRLFQIVLLLLNSRELLAKPLQIAAQDVDSLFTFLVHIDSFVASASIVECLCGVSVEKKSVDLRAGRAHVAAAGDRHRKYRGTGNGLQKMGSHHPKDD